MNPLILLCLPLPPPYSGEEALGLALRRALEEIGPKAYDVFYFDISSKRTNSKRGQLSLGNLWALGRLVSRFFVVLLIKKPSVVYLPIAQNFFGFLKYSIFIQLAALFNCQIVAILGGSHFHLFFKRSRPVFKKWIQGMLNNIDLLIVQGEALKKQFEGLMDSQKLRVVPIGLEPKLFFESNGKALAKNKVDVLFVGCLSKAKGIFELLEAIPLVAKEVPYIHFHLVGEVIEKERNVLHIANPTNNRKEFLNRTSHRNIQPYLTYHGVLYGEEKIRLYKQSDIFVLPSYSESFPFVLLEAAASGLPIVTTGVGANPETYKAGENALFVEAGNVTDLAQKIIELAKNPHLREQMGKNNISLVKANHTHIHFGKRMDRIFSEALRIANEI